jgi:hypothetical protein
MVGDLDVALDVFKAGGDVGKDGGEEIVASHALDLRRNFFAVLEAQEREGAVGVPAEAGGEDGRAGEHGLLQDILDGLRLEEVEDVGEREAVLLGEGDVDAVVGGGGLQFEVEAAAEALAQGQAPGAVDARAEGRVDDELHAAAFVEEALGDDAALGGDGSEDGAAVADVGGELAQRVGSMPASAKAPLPTSAKGWEIWGTAGVSGFPLTASSLGVPGVRKIDMGRCIRFRYCVDTSCRCIADELAEFADVGGELEGAGGGFAAPEGDVGRLAVGVFDEDASGAGSTRWMRQLVLPRSMMSPAWDSMAKSSSRVPMTVSVGRATTLRARYPGWLRRR